MAADTTLGASLAKLEDSTLDARQKCFAAQELRDNVDSWSQGPDYAAFLEKAVPVFLKVLDGAPVFLNISPEQKLRNSILEILQRLPGTQADVIGSHAPKIVDKLMDIVREENEDNDIIIVKTISDFVRHYNKALEDRVQPFLDLIKEMFEKMDQTISETFDAPAPGAPGALPATPHTAQFSQSPKPGSPVSTSASELGGEQQQTRQLQKGMHSFKVLCECPIIVVSIFQAHRNITPKYASQFVPLIKQILISQAKPQEKAHAEAKAKGEIFVGVSPGIKNRAAFGDFINMQVKTMSFLAYLLRAYRDQLNDFLAILPDIVIRMLRDCPRERSGARKELLVAIRHIINFNFRKIFIKKIDELLDERTLIGDGLTVYETMRPLAYSMLADLIHHLRESLSKEQIRRAIEVYTKNLHDDFPGTSFQTMSAKLLLNMAEYIAKKEPKEDGRHFLIMILNAIGDKFAAMNRQYHNAVKISAQHKPPSIETSAENYLADKDSPPDWDEIDIFSASPIKTSSPRDRSSDPIQENRFLFKNLVTGLKGLFFQLRLTNPPRPEGEDAGHLPPNWHEVSYAFDAEQLNVLIKLLREGCQVFRFYGTDKQNVDSQNLTTSELLATQNMMAGGKDEKDLLEAFATVFHLIDPAIFHEVFASEIPHLYEMCFEHAPLLHIAQFLLASEATSPNFCGLLLQFLMNKIEDIGTADTQKASLLLRLFKLSFMAVTLFAPQNEQVLQPHVVKIVTKAIELSTTAEDPTNYFLLLRSLFRSIGGGRFEHLYKELLPLLEMLLDVLNNLLKSARKPQERDLFVELILTVPARLSNLLPHLSYLMRPLVVALRAGSELVGQGLRTLELCVDNLTADYIDPIMAPVIDELMKGLWEHLKPAPYNHFHAHTTMRILGKLGGRNRKFLDGLPPLDYKPYTDDVASFDVKLTGTAKDRAFPSSIGVEMAVNKLSEMPRGAVAKASDSYYKRQAFKMITSQIKLLIGLEQLPEDFPQLVRLQAQDFASGTIGAGEDLYTQSEREKSAIKCDAQQDELRTLLKAVHFAQSVPDLKEDAVQFATGICRHFMLLELGRSVAQYKHRPKPFDPKSGEGPLFIDSKVIADVIADCLSSETAAERTAAEQSLLICRESLVTIFGSSEGADKLPFISTLSRVLAHHCHQEEWYLKAGGTLGLDIVVNKLDVSDSWLLGRHLDIIRALLYVIKDMPADVTAKVRLHASDLLQTLVRRITRSNFKATDIKDPETKLFQLCKVLVLELMHIGVHVRVVTQKLFSIIAEELNMDIAELINPVKDIMLAFIFNKPLRALPFPAQIAYIDAITYCLSLNPQQPPAPTPAQGEEESKQTPAPSVANSIIPFNDQLTRLLTECLALADTDDESLSSKPTEFRNADNIVKLRAGCIKLLTVAQNQPDFMGGAARGSSEPVSAGAASSPQQRTPASIFPNSQSRARIITVFFKSLYFRNPEVIAAANAGLKSVLGVTSKLPKDLLQSGLKPVLMNLQDPRKLSVEGLEGLARLLKLLPNYFKVEVGARLLEHLKILAEPAVLQKVSFTLLEQNKQMRVIAAIIDIVHLLPPAAVDFMPNVVGKVLDLESQLRRTQGSLFRAPLLRFLNLYPQAAWKFFCERLKDLTYGRFWAQLLATEDAMPLRNAVFEESAMLLAQLAANNAEDGASADVVANRQKEKHIVQINAIHMISSLCQYEQTKVILVKQDQLRKALFGAAKDLEKNVRDNSIDSSLRLAAEQAGEQLLRLFVIYLELENEERTNFEVFVQLVDAVTAGRLKYSFHLPRYIYRNIIDIDDLDRWRKSVFRCIEFYASKNTSQKAKTYLFRHVVIPVLAMDIKRNWESLFVSAPKGTKLVDKTMINAIDTKLWRPVVENTIDDQSQQGVDHSRMELLQLTALLLKYHTTFMAEPRKTIIRFAWVWGKGLEDVVNKNAAYVVVAYFINLFDTPPKLAVVTYNDLLKAHQNECRSLVTQGLELLAPVLKKRLNHTEHRLPMWANRPRKILVEDSHNLQQLMSVFNFLVRHDDVFYEVREMLVPSIIPSLARIAAPAAAGQSPSNEHKKAALNVVNLIWKWEQRAYKESIGLSPSASPTSLKRKLDGSPVLTKAPELATPQLRMGLIKYLVQFMASLTEPYPLPQLRAREAAQTHGNLNVQPAQPSEIAKMTIRLLHNLLKPPYWADLELDQLLHKVLEPLLSRDAPEESEKAKYKEWYIRTLNCLEVLKVFVNVKPEDWVVNRVVLFQKLVDKATKMEDTVIQAVLHGEDENLPDTQPLLACILRAIPVSDAATTANGTNEDETMEDTPASDFVAALNTIAGEALGNSNLLSAINLIWTLSKSRPKEIDQHVPALMKVFTGKLAKDHLAANTQLQSYRPGEQPQQQPPPEFAEFEIQTGLLLKSIDILAGRMEVLGEHRRPYLSALASIVERSHSREVCMKIMDLSEQWVFNSENNIPTLKEKVAVLSKMLFFENRQDQTLLTRFLDLVIRVYEDPKVTRTELTVRLENAFLVGCRAQDVDMRNRFLAIFDKHISRTPSARIDYLLCHQDWNTLGDTFWLSQVIQMLFGSLEMSQPIQLHQDDFRTMPAATWFNTYAKDPRISDVMIDDAFETMMLQNRRFCAQLADVKLRDIMEPLAQLQHVDRNLAKDIWVAIFPLFWSALPKEDRPDFEVSIANLLTKDFHYRQLDQRPNCVQALLEGVIRARPRMKIPPHVIKFLAKTYSAWYMAANYLEESAVSPIVDTAAVRESTIDALVDIYHGLEETDLFYGTWRRRCQYVETNAALSYEQIGMWDKAQQMYEGAQIKARTGALPFSQGEYLLWEDHWILCAQKLQQWEILMDFAKHENFNDLYLEATWRNFDAWTNTDMREQLDSIIKSVGDAPTPRRTFFQAFMSLLKLHSKTELPQDFNRNVDEAIQLSIKKWHQLPKRITNAHIGLLQHFQQLVELHDAQIISTSLAQTTQANLDVKSQELKMLLGTWRDRLPNFWDDINAWQDLVTWRQHIFHMVNAVYLNMVPPNQGNANNNSFAYRGYHETAWIINRFAHVARQHNLQDVCIAQLSKIYTLPNIEIQEAFLKLREQAKCHYQNKAELAAGLDVINNTNLNYFGPPQKAEFYALKGMFLNKLGQKNDANDAFGMALYFDIKLPKAWAEWGRYNDQLFKEDPKNLEKASSAISCYLEAASQFKNAKSRKLLGRILWLLSLDDGDQTLSKTFDNFKGDTPVWYWITFIPQLLLGLSRPEAPIMAQLLKKLAKQYPQALYFQLRTSREDLHVIRKQQEAKEAKEKEMKEKRAKALAAQQSTPKKEGDGQGKQATPNKSSSPVRPGTAGAQVNGESTPSRPGQPDGTTATPKNEPGTDAATATPNGTTSQVTNGQKKPWDHADDITSALKTAFPLLAWSMEAIVDTICKHFKCMPDEDAHRLIVALYNDGIAYVGRSPHLYAPENKLPAATEANITRFAESVCPKHVRESFMQDFVNNKPTMYDYIQRLRKWRNRFEERLDRRPNPVYLESLTLHLSEFRFTKFDEVEIPGQYLLYRDKNQNFIRIERFLPEVDLVRGTNVSHRRLKIRGHDGSVHPFQIQHPAGRYGRREERISQLFRAFNATLLKRKEARRRNLAFNLPLIVPLSPNVRMIEDDPSYTNLQSIYEDYCRSSGVNKDDPILYTIEKLRAAQPVGSPTFFADLPSKQGRLTGAELQKTIENANNIKLEIFTSVQEKFCPNTVALNYFKDTFERFDDYWLFRKAFAYQFAAHAFMTYIFYMNGRVPHKFNISRKTGKVWGIEMYPSMASQRAVFHNPEHVPIRLTPNLQTLMGPLITEGIFAPSIMAIARCLTDADSAADGTTSELEMQLSVFVRDEVSFWCTQQHRAAAVDGMLREMVQMNSDQVAKRAKTLANPPEGRPGNLPANQTVVDLVAASVRPGALANSDVLWMGYL